MTMDVNHYRTDSREISLSDLLNGATETTVQDQYLVRLDDSAASVTMGRMYELQKAGRFCDMKITGKDGHLDVHRVVVASACPVVLSNIPSGKISNFNISHPDASVKLLDLFVKLIYTGYVSVPASQKEDLKSICTLFKVLPNAEKISAPKSSTITPSSGQDTSVHPNASASTTVSKTSSNLQKSSSINSGTNRITSSNFPKVLQSPLKESFAKSLGHLASQDEEDNAQKQRQSQEMDSLQAVKNLQINYIQSASNQESESPQAVKSLQRENTQNVCFNDDIEDMDISDDNHQMDDEDEIKVLSCVVSDKSLGAFAEEIIMLNKSPSGPGIYEKTPVGVPVKFYKCTACSVRKPSLFSLVIHFGQPKGSSHQGTTRACRKNLTSKFLELAYDLPPMSCETGGRVRTRKCFICQSYPSRAPFEYHMRWKHGYPWTFQCKVCSMKFLKEFDAEAHALDHLSAMADNTEFKHELFKGYQCAKCLQIVSMAWEEFEDHEKTCLSEEVYMVCHECGKKIKGKDEWRMRRHMENVHAQEGPQSPCPHCGKMFKKLALKRHIDQVHYKRNNSACAHCGKVFSTKYDLRMHERLHTGEKPFPCKICGEGFITNQLLQKHIKKEHFPYRNI